ncbi:integrin alpha-2-like isoform X1 [Ctenopharyngodon idella]|uniref:integrin alpha-2-like isoform X1 n=1 Tax=Ctenopharyngodon idella TaxID=7959 RepID=UPI00223134DD|nr:integrin alpha-2-like isoform X1 [Ctenopharyngodon idella]
MDRMEKVVILLILLQSFCIARTLSFNVGTAGAKIFSSGPGVQEFGYTVRQLSSNQGKWLLVGSPWSGYPQNRKGDLYKCDTGPRNNCQKLNLQDSISVDGVQSINMNMSLGLTITPIAKPNRFLTCGPLWAQRCGSQYFYPGVCAELSPQFTLQPAFSPAIQTCGGPMDVAIVLDGSNSIYPWPEVINFLVKLLENLDIRPDQTRVSIMQYSEDLSFLYHFNSDQNKEKVLSAASAINQKTGVETNTFAALDNARQTAFLRENGGRAGATKVLVVVTDGESSDGHRGQEVIERLNRDGIIRFGIAILKKSANIQKFIKEIELIASTPTENYMFNVSSEEALINIAGTLGDRIFNIEGTSQGQEFQLEMSQVGFSAHQTNKKDEIMLGAVGAYGWTGTVIHQTAGKSHIFLKNAFEKTLDDRNHSSLLGYSVSSVTDGSSEFYVAGAPRAVHRGQVVVYTINSQGQPVIINSQRGDQIGSYFGSVLCPVDVDIDGVTDLLLVGAPMYMSEEKSETGRVYLFTITKGILSNQGFLEGSQKNGRFGTAITVIPDLNMDGFSDVVVGAPMEGNGQGAIYVYYGDGKTIRKQSSQKIIGTKLDPAMKYFGRSLDGRGDMNEDSIPDVTVGAFGKVVQLWSRAVAVVTAKVSFTPDKISILSKPCRYSGRQVSCFKAKVCFSATFKPMNPLGPVDIKYNLSLDADLQSSRISPRGHFSNMDRVIQKDISVSAKDICEEHDVYVQETPDLVNSIALRVDVVLSSTDAKTVLDIFSPNAWEFFIPFSKDCGQDEVCFSDLVLTVESEQKLGSSKSPLVVSQNKKRLSFTVTVMNRKENAYNARVSVIYSRNLFYASFTPLIDGTEVKCTLMKDSDTLTCQVSYPALRTDQLVTFVVNFDFNMNQLLNDASVVFEALSDSTEETPADNRISVSIPVQYNSEIILSRESNLGVYLLEKEDNFATTVKDYKDIGPDFNFNIKVSTGTVPVSLIYLNVSLPSSTRAGNPLLYTTSIKTSPAEKIHCADSHQIDPFKISQKPYTAQFTEESFRGTEELNCKTATCWSMKCVLKDLEGKNDYYVNVTTNIWNGTFAMADFLYVVLSVRADIETSQPDLLFIEQKNLKVEVKVSKPGAKGDVPVGVIAGSVIGGLLLLALAVALLWKVLYLPFFHIVYSVYILSFSFKNQCVYIQFGFFKRKYQSLMKNDENAAEHQELQENSEAP